MLERVDLRLGLFRRDRSQRSKCLSYGSRRFLKTGSSKSGCKTDLRRFFNLRGNSLGLMFCLSLHGSRMVD